METELTKNLKLGIWNSTHAQGTFGCFEVTIGWFGHERVDYMTYDTNGVWRCYEIKITKSDFHSKNHNTFIGNLNYYIMPKELFEQVKGEIPEGIGVYVPEEQQYRGYPRIKSVRRAVHRDIGIDEQTMKNSMIRSLCREFDKQMQSGNENRISLILRETRQYESENRSLHREVQYLRNEIYELEHPERVKEALEQ